MPISQWQCAVSRCQYLSDDSRGATPPHGGAEEPRPTNDVAGGVVSPVFRTREKRVGVHLCTEPPTFVPSRNKTKRKQKLFIS